MGYGKRIAEIKIVKDVIDFFENEGEFGLIEFELQLIDIGHLSTHDDGECHFQFKNKEELINLLKIVTPNKYQNLIISKLFDNPGIYLQIDELGNLKKYHTFDQYLKTNNT